MAGRAGRTGIDTKGEKCMSDFLVPVLCFILVQVPLIFYCYLG